MKTNFLKSLLAIACLLCSIGVYAHDFEVDGIYYNKLSSTEVEVTYRGSSYDSYTNEYTRSVVIPESVTYSGVTYSVTSIGDHAFYNCDGLTSVTIPNSVTSIGTSAFSGCWGLTEITIPNSVTSIADRAFYGCTGLTEITIPNSVTEIGNEAFYNTPFYNNQPDGVIYLGSVLYNYKGTMPMNTSIFVKEGTISITGSAFHNCTGLTEITIPNSVTEIGSYAFACCTRLTEITIPNSVTSIGYYAFYFCTGLTEITIPNSVTSISDYTFVDCKGLTTVTIPNSVTSIGYGAFRACTGLTEVTIPNSVTEIGLSAFEGCTSLTEVTIPNSVTEIGHSAFSGCTGLKSLIIPNSVTSIEYRTFSNCAGLTEITIPNSVTEIGSYAFAYCTRLTEITIPNSVTSIGQYAFSGCWGLTSVTIPNSVTSIDEYAFYNCTGLTTVNFNAEKCTTMGSSSYPVFKNCTNLTTINIGDKVTKIPDRAFDLCTGLQDIYAYPIVPPTIGQYTFTDDINNNATLHLYKKSQDAYAEADYWGYFVKIGTIKKEYTLTYLVDDKLYAQESYFEGDVITPLAEPVKENYIFSGWSEIPETMPENDVTVTGNFTFVIDDSVLSYNIQEAISLDELIYIRNFDNTDWQAWYVPFEVDIETLKDVCDIACINNVHQYDLDKDGELDYTELEAVIVRNGVVKANYPYLIKFFTTGEKQIKVNNVTLQPTEEQTFDCMSLTYKYFIRNTYNVMSGNELAQNACYIMQDNMLQVPTDETVELGAFRWYLQIEERGDKVKPQRVVLNVKDDLSATGVDEVVSDTNDAPAEYYDLSGRRVVEPTSGIYIVKQGNTVRKVFINKAR